MHLGDSWTFFRKRFNGQPVSMSVCYIIHGSISKGNSTGIDVPGSLKIFIQSPLMKKE
jgi:hypothetical protein